MDYFHSTHEIRYTTSSWRKEVENHDNLQVFCQHAIQHVNLETLSEILAYLLVKHFEQNTQDVQDLVDLLGVDCYNSRIVPLQDI